jgi:gamma-glutamylcyclotransferase (GGCT)/AIG2-like uncharacterized protein YtfP
VTPTLVAVYGSLRRPYTTLANLGLSVRFVGPCLIQGELRDFGRYPALVAGHGTVVGDLIEVGPRELEVLDHFESYYPGNEDGSMYVRETVRLIEPDVEADVYRFLGPAAGRPRVNSGDWVEWLNARGQDGSLAPD